MAKYEARHIKDEYYLVVKRRWFGLALPHHRIAIWDGYHFNDNGARPDWFWESTQGKPTKIMVRGRIRDALLKAYRQVHGLEPADWVEGIPPARLLEAVLD